MSWQEGELSTTAHITQSGQVSTLLSGGRECPSPAPSSP